MTLPSVSVSKKDGNLGLVSAGASKPLVIGPCSGGTKETVYTFAQVKDLISSLGYGPVQVAAGIILADNGGSVDVMVSSGSIAATKSSVVSSSSPAITLSGTPYDSYDASGVITKAGDLGVGKFKFSLDGQETYSPEITIPTAGTYVIPNTGLSMSFTAGTHSLAKTFSFTTEAPQMNTTDLSNCIAVYKLESTTPTFIEVANDSFHALSGSNLATGMNTHLTTLETYEVSTLGVVPTGGNSTSGSSDVISKFSSVQASEGNVLAVVAERARILVPSPFMGYANPRLPFSYAVCSRLQGSKISTNPARVADGGLNGVTDPSYDEFFNGEVYKPENIIAPRTFNGSGGVYVNQGLLKSAAGSDYKYVQWGRVINRADQVIREGLRKYINRNVRVKTDGTGVIDERDALNIEKDINAQLSAAIMLPLNEDGFAGHASAVQFTVVRTNNVLTTSEVEGTAVVVPLANVSNVSVQLSFATAVTPV